MSRTFRNKTKAPKGVEVRDNGKVFLEGKEDYSKKFRKSYVSKEVTDVRRMLDRKFRRGMKYLLKKGKWEMIHKPKKTQGWNSW